MWFFARPLKKLRTEALGIVGANQEMEVAGMGVLGERPWGA